MSYSEKEKNKVNMQIYNEARDLGLKIGRVRIGFCKNPKKRKEERFFKELRQVYKNGDP